MDRIRDNDCDEEVYRIRRPSDEPSLSEQRQQDMEEAREFHDEWSRRNPNHVYGQSII
jgi:hypothetical protein